MKYFHEYVLKLALTDWLWLLLQSNDSAFDGKMRAAITTMRHDQ